MGRADIAHVCPPAWEVGSQQTRSQRAAERANEGLGRPGLPAAGRQQLWCPLACPHSPGGAPQSEHTASWKNKARERWHASGRFTVCLLLSVDPEPPSLGPAAQRSRRAAVFCFPRLVLVWLLWAPSLRTFAHPRHGAGGAAVGVCLVPGAPAALALSPQQARPWGWPSPASLSVNPAGLLSLSPACHLVTLV